MVVDARQRHGVRWGRAAARACFLLIGGVQCVLGVILGVSLLAGFFINGEGPGGGIGLVLLDLVLLAPGVLALLSSFEPWDPPGDRWNGLRWSALGLAGSGLTLCSWAVAAMLLWAT